MEDTGMHCIYSGIFLLLSKDRFVIIIMFRDFKAVKKGEI